MANEYTLQWETYVLSTASASELFDAECNFHLQIKEKIVSKKSGRTPEKLVWVNFWNTHYLPYGWYFLDPKMASSI